MELDIIAENCAGKKYVRATLKRRSGETLADCRRIAALYSNAPELLEALEALWGYSLWCSETNNVPNFIQDDMGGRIQNVIEKAKGASNA